MINSKEKKCSKNGRDLCERVVSYIIDCPIDELKNLTVNSITQEFGVSKMHIGNVFKARKEITPGKFIYRHKMLRARSLMQKNGGLKVREVAEILGYSTTDYFIRIFKKFFGKPPCQYRDLKAEQDDVIKYSLKEGRNK